MICDHCVNSNHIKTGVPSCFLPHCNKDTAVLLERIQELSGTNDRGIEWQMIVREIRRRNGAYAKRE